MLIAGAEAVWTMVQSAHMGLHLEAVFPMRSAVTHAGAVAVAPTLFVTRPCHVLGALGFLPLPALFGPFCLPEQMLGMGLPNGLQLLSLPGKESDECLGESKFLIHLRAAGPK